jgi:hypothetical protein
MAAPAATRAIGETTGLFKPSTAQQIPSKIIGTEASSKENQLKEFARNMGMSEEELTLAIKEGGLGQNWLANVSSKGSRVAGAIDATRDSIGRVYGTLQSSPAAQTPLSGKQASKFINEISTKISDLPHESAIRIQQDYNKLLGSSMSGNDLMKFYKNLNYYIGKGERGLGTLKGPIEDGITSISPELGKDFKLTNKLYRNFANLSEKLGPDVLDRAMSLGEQGMAFTGIITGNYPLIEKVVGITAARALAREMIVNPRMKNLTARFVNGVQRNSPAIARKVYDQMLVEVGKTNAEAAMKMSGLDVEELFSQQDQEGQSLE